MKQPCFEDIKEAHSLIKKSTHYTPIMSCDSINRIVGAELTFKCENFQKTGAFKFRGACNAVFSLSDDSLRNGVATHSSGNHAAALALAARHKGVKAFIIMPENAPKIKKMAVEGYGAEITFCKPTLKARESTLKKVVQKTGAVEIHPYNSFKVISGQGTAARELLNEVIPNIIMCPVGGGGLLAGTAITSKAIHPECKIVAAEPAGADDAYRSFRAGKIIPSNNPVTVADGLLTSLGDLNFQVIKDKVDDIITVEEASIVNAMRLIWERMKIIIEPSSAVPLAAIIENRQRFAGEKIGIILSGGNLDFENLPF